MRFIVEASVVYHINLYIPPLPKASEAKVKFPRSATVGLDKLNVEKGALV